MGGVGSGRRAKSGRDNGGKRSTDDCFSLDIGFLRQSGALEHGALGTFTSDHRYVKTACVGDVLIVLSFMTFGPRQQRIALDWTECAYGNERPWFVCSKCSSRAGVLYLGGIDFACRKCCGLVYPSQNEEAPDRARRRALKLRKRLGAELYVPGPLIQKPKGMQEQTFRKTLDALKAAEDEALQADSTLCDEIARRLRNLRRAEQQF